MAASTLTQKGQITIPKEIRDALGLRPFDRVEIRLEGDEARLSRARLTLEEIAGSLPPLDVPVEDMPTLAKTERARRAVQRHT